MREVKEFAAKLIRIVVSRWDVQLIITKMDDSTETWIASADNFFTEGDRIWFGTQEEYDAEIA